MVFKKGDRVKFLNDTGGGIVTRVERAIVYVENEDGFEIPVAAPQLLPVEVSQAGQAPVAFSASARTKMEVQVENLQSAAESATDTIDLTGDTDASGIDVSVNILLAWMPLRKKNKNGETVYDVYLIDACSYHIAYVAAMISEGAYRGLQAGMLESDSLVHLAQISGDQLKQADSIRIETLFFKKGAYMPQEPMRYELRINEFHITDALNYVPNEYFDEKALIYHISEEYLMAEIENAASETQKQFAKQKQLADQPQPKPVKKAPLNNIKEVDLHIEQLVDNPKAFTSAEMLDIQMNHFTASLNDAIRNRTKRIVFIHGVGNGRLRLEIQRLLAGKYPKLRYQDASFKEYGYGATLIFPS